MPFFATAAHDGDFLGDARRVGRLSVDFGTITNLAVEGRTYKDDTPPSTVIAIYDGPDMTELVMDPKDACSLGVMLVRVFTARYPELLSAMIDKADSGLLSLSEFLPPEAEE